MGKKLLLAAEASVVEASAKGHRQASPETVEGVEALLPREADYSHVPAEEVEVFLTHREGPNGWEGQAGGDEAHRRVCLRLGEGDCDPCEEVGLARALREGGGRD